MFEIKVKCFDKLAMYQVLEKFRIDNGLEKNEILKFIKISYPTYERLGDAQDKRKTSPKTQRKVLVFMKRAEIV